MPNILLAVKIPETLKQQIEQYIKANYPKYKTYSEVVREALKQFLKESEGNERKMQVSFKRESSNQFRLLPKT